MYFYQINMKLNIKNFRKNPQFLQYYFHQNGQNQTSKPKNFMKTIALNLKIMY